MSVVHLHLLLNHVPVIGMLFVALMLIVSWSRRSSEMGKLGFATLAGLGVITAVVYFTGEPAEEAVENLAAVSETLIHAHEEAADAAFIATGVAAGFALAVLWWRRRRELPRWLIGLGFVLVLGVSGLMGWTANLGGQIRHSEIRSGSVAQVKDDEH